MYHALAQLGTIYFFLIFQWNSLIQVYILRFSYCIFIFDHLHLQFKATKLPIERHTVFPLIMSAAITVNSILEAAASIFLNNLLPRPLLEGGL